MLLERQIHVYIDHCNKFNLPATVDTISRHFLTTKSWAYQALGHLRHKKIIELNMKDKTYKNLEEIVY